MWGIPELVQKISDFFQKLTGVSDYLVWFFNPEFLGLIGLTAIVVGSSFVVSYFFPSLRAPAGAAVVGTIGAWYGFIKGKASRQTEIDRLKAQAKAKPKVSVPVVKKDPWTW